ncbi:hypothetical protein GYMLUDRAFT_40923 [Collybiopsis luxurians FD-317 M1]|uniref:Uncharacterized protein n=1 Tax=Collybiopsis luxurians FD-317 M1 TaxID=944289 RepID=A0A0D0CVU4_9AGAR|nr:hypothetical protein GYMLUDRAFT_40923 [Collybiopsis luxurians FD-317 M1]
MDNIPSTPTENSLHLEFNTLNLDTKPDDSPAATKEKSEKEPEHKDRKKPAPYVDPDRVKTGGSQRDKLSEEELAERMARIREQNEKIKLRRVDVQADEEAFRKTQEAERAKLARTRKVQESVDNAREVNAKRKMEKIQSREWDSGKPSPSDWKARNQQSTPTSPSKDSPQETTEGDGSSVASSMWARGGGSGRGRGRGRGRGGRRGRTSPEPTVASTDDKAPQPEAQAEAS